jgi:hypothetical protein
MRPDRPGTRDHALVRARPGAVHALLVTTSASSATVGRQAEPREQRESWMSQQQRHVGPAGADTPLSRGVPERAARHGGSLLRRAVDGAAALVVTSGAVAAVAGVLWTSGTSTALAWLVLGIGGGHVAVGAWVALTGPSSPQDLARAGAWLSAFVVLHGLLPTSPGLYYRLVVTLAALCLVRAHLIDADDRTESRVPGQRLRAP